ncbi:MAG: lipopolysaccharide biosynthesis protein [Promethearchaeota archaeon]
MSNVHRRRAASGMLFTIAILTLASASLPGGSATPNGTAGGTPVPEPAASAGGPPRVGFLENFSETKLVSGLGVDPAVSLVNLSESTLESGLGGVDVLVLANWSLGNDDAALVRSFVDSGGSVLLCLGNPAGGDGTILGALGLVKNESTRIVEAKGIWHGENASHPLVRAIPWNAVPEARVFAQVSWDPDATETIMDTLDGGYPLLVEARAFPTRVLVLSILLSSDDNPDFELNPYFNFFLYRLVKYLEREPAESYEDWPYSPVPHEQHEFGIFLYIGLISLIGFGGFFLARRRSRKPIDEYMLERAAQLGIVEVEPGGAPADGARPRSGGERESEFESADSGGDQGAPVRPTADPGILDELKEDTSSSWEQIGLHRQVASFFYTLLLSFVVAIPTLVVTMFLYPRYIMPYPQAAGWFNWTSAFFAALYNAFDLGTGVALVKYFSEYRISQPKKALKYAQIFIWWQMLTGVVQIGIISSLAVFYFPGSSLAHISWIFILTSLGQFPGMLNAVQLTLEGMQRLDKKVLTDIIAGAVVNPLLNYGSILACRAIFSRFPAYGDVFGAAIGMAIGGLLGGWGTFAVTSAVFRRLGFSLKTLFRVDFGREEVKEALSFGWKLTIGNLLVPAVGMLEVWLISIYVLNYNAEMGYYGMMNTIALIIGATGTFFSGLKPGISEAHGNDKYKLLEYYCIEGLRYNNLFTFILFGAVLAIGAPLLVGFAGSKWAPATRYLPVLALFSLLGPYSWFGDTMFQGTGNTKYNAYTWVVEQGIRASLLLLFFTVLKSNRLETIMYAYLPALFTKDVLMWLIIRRKIVRFDWHPWHTFATPAISAFLTYLYAKALVGIVWVPDLASSIVLFLATIFGGLFIYLFLMGLLGGWDDNTLGEFRRSLEVVAAVRWFFVVLYKVTEVGHRISPLRNRFPVKVFEVAMAQARELTEMKKKLVI